MFKRLLATILVALAAMSSAAFAQSTELNQRTHKYGFEVRNLTNVQCNSEASAGRQWHSICISNTRSKDHTVIAWKQASFKKLDVQLGFGGDMLAAKGETVSWQMTCKSDPSFVDPANMNGSIVDCSWRSPDTGKPTVYATFLYFVPNPGTGVENVLIFSDFGKGENADETKNRARTFLFEGNLSRLQK